MSEQQSLQDRVNKYLIQVQAEDLGTAIKEAGVEIDPKGKLDVLKMADINKVIIPDTMNELQASYSLLKIFEEKEKFRNYNRSYTNFFLNDFMVSVQAMVNKYFGMLHVSNIDTSGRPSSPDYIQIPIKYDSRGKLITEKGYIGSVKCPGWEECIMDIGPNNLIVRSKLKFETEVNKFLQEVEDHIKANSVVTGNAVTIKEHKYGLLTEPINPKINNRIVLSESTERIVANLIIPQLEDKRKASLLFIGAFGTGKTESAIRIGVEAREKFGRTFFYLHDCEMLPKLIPYLKVYQRAVCFIEDLDQISAGDRDTEMNNLLNQIDGNELKNVDCTFIFTTNSEDKIHPAMRRPGRIDQIVKFDTCDKYMVSRIYQLWAQDAKIQEEIDYDFLADETPINQPGAVIKEIASRAVGYANKLHAGVISASVFQDAIASMRHHIEFMSGDQKKDHSAENLLGHLLFKGFKKAFPAFESADYGDYGKDSPYKGLDS